MDPAGTTPIDGVVHRRSPYPVDDTVARLRHVIEQAGAKLFLVADQTAEAAQVGQTLPPTTLVVFGNPTAGTPLMRAAPLVALDLPLKVLVWEDGAGQVWMTYLAADWLADRYGISAEHAGPLAAPELLTGRLVPDS